jgi:hypothetical protein
MDLRLYAVPPKRRYWVVRAEAGTYLPHFLKWGIVTIGHLDALADTYAIDLMAETNWPTVHQNLIKAFERSDRQYGGLSSLVGQARAFTDDARIGDWVMTPGQEQLRIGVITSEVYWDASSLVIEPLDRPPVVLQHKLRRTVTWGPVVYKGDFTSPLQRSLWANQTVFNVDQHWEAICHSLYPAFSRDDTLYLSAKIKTPSSVQNVDVAAYLSILSDVEVIARNLKDGLTRTNFEKELHESADKGELTLATKAEFYSPGDIWVQLSQGSIGFFSKEHWMEAVVLAYSMIFGNSKLGFDGILDLDTSLDLDSRKKISDLMLSRLEKRQMKRVVERLEAAVPEKMTSTIESLDDLVRDRD